MPTIAELEIRVDSTPLERGTKALNDFAQASDKAASANEKKKSSDDKLASSSKQVADTAESAAKSTEKQSKELETLLGKIDPITKKLNDLAKQEAALFANKGNISTAAFDAYNAKLQESVDKLSGVGAAQRQASAGTEGVPERLKAVAQAAFDAATAQERLTTATKGASEAEQGIVSSGAVSAANSRADAALKEYEAKRQLAQGTKGAADAERGQVSALGDLLAKIDPSISKLNELDRLQKELAKQKSSGAIGGEDFEKYNGILERSRTTQIRYNDALQTTGKTAKETAFALRGLPAQFTDIVVSLQGGQAPFTVLLQQGGQIKDTFGGIVPAFKAVGGALLAMVSPLTVVAGLIAALGVAAYQGSNELTEFGKAAASSAGFSGVTADAFLTMQRNLDGISGTSRDAATALTALESSGKIAGDQFEKIALAAINMQRATGQAIQATVDDFASLAKDPVSAVVTLDDKYKFLTASVLAQVDALQRQGDLIGAVSLAQNELAAGAENMAKNIQDNLGIVERSWRGVRDIALEAWDAVLNVGRQQSSGDQLKQLQEALSQLETRGGSVTPTGQGVSTKTYVGDQGVKDLRERIGFLKQSIDFTNKETEAKAANKRAEEVARQAANVATNSQIARSSSSGTQVERARSELDKVEREQKAILAYASLKGVEITEEQTALYVKNKTDSERKLAEAIKADAEKGKTKSSPVDNTQIQEVKNNLDSIKSEYSNYYKEVTALGEANIVSRAATYASQKSILEAEAKAVDDSYEQQIAAIKRLQGNKTNSAQANISLNNQLNKAESDRAKAAEANASKQEVLDTKEKGRIDARTASIEAYNDALKQQIENTAVSGERQAAAVGKGDRQGKVDEALADNDRSYAKDQAKLAKSLSNGMDPEEYATNLKNLTAAHTAMADQIVANDARIQEANADWTNGFTKAIQNAADEGNNFADSINRAVSGAFDSMGDALGTFVTTGKLNFSDLARSIITDLAKIAAKQAASSALSSLFGLASTAASAYFGGAGGATASAGSTAAGYSSTYFPQAKGGAWDSGTKFFAQGGAFTNSIVSNPTAFGMSGGGTGVMGEAGPEAIVPLARSSDGSLGVRLVGSSTGASGSAVNVYVNVSSDGTSSSSDSPAYEGFGKELADFVDTRVNSLLNKGLKDGGQINRAIKG
jgi:lambda family phage tail tape measure protein